MQVSAVVVNYEGARIIEPCLRSLEATLEHAGVTSEIVVVDNASQDGSASASERALQSGRVLRLPANVGFGAAVNRGVEVTTGEWVLVLNNDIVLARDAVVALMAATASGDVGSVAAQMRFHDAPSVINSAGIGVDQLGVAFDRHLGAPVSASESALTDVFGACGGAALYRRKMLIELGGFDESFFMYLEDVDLAWRARMRGWRAVYQPAAVVFHHHSATSGHGSPSKYYFVGRNRMRLLAKNMATTQLLWSLPRIVAYDLGYSAFVAGRAGTLAPVSGRAAGLASWRRFRRVGARSRRSTSLERVQGFRRALARNRAWPGVARTRRGLA